MNTEKSDQKSLTEGNNALKLFTDRNELTRQFAEYLNYDPSPEKILFFHGEGGNGKSLLLKFLREKCCKRFSYEKWHRLKGDTDKLVRNVSADITDIEKDTQKDYTVMPASMLDFGQQPRGDDQPQDPFYGLLMLRRNLVAKASKLGYKLEFPHYDFAWVWYLQTRGRSSKDIKNLLPPDEMELIGVIIDALMDSAWGNLVRAALRVLEKYLGFKVGLVWREWGLDEQWLRDLKAMDPDTELIDTLPHWFARDLNEAMKKENAPRRLVLFFDSHETFWGYERSLPDQSFFYKDEWLRCLLSSLELSRGIVVVAAGHEKPRWAEAPRMPIPNHRLDTQFVWHLSAADAEKYLKNAGIPDADLQQSLIACASVTPDQVHPFYLGLCADVVRTAARPPSPSDFASIPATAAKSKMLIGRLLKHVGDAELGDAIRALSACHDFDRDLYLMLGKSLHFQATAAKFRILTHFSFVWQDRERREGWYRIHGLLRRLYNKEQDPMTLDAHKFLEEHYRSRGETENAIYHAICRDWHRGVKEWLDVFDNAEARRDMELCRRLQKIEEEIWEASGKKEPFSSEESHNP